MSEPLPSHRPPREPEAAPYWDASAEGRLVLPVCNACGHLIWYPRSWCPACGADSVTWTEVSGRGTVYARTVIRKSMGPWAAAAPYLAAYVELEEGPRILANVVADDPDTVQVGTAVRAVFAPVTDPPGKERDEPQAILRFEPAG